MGYRFITDAGIRYVEVEVKPKLGRVVKRIYQYTFHIYLIAAHDGRLYALRAKRSEPTVFTDLVSIRYTEDNIFLEDSRNKPVLVKNFKLTEEMLQHYLTIPSEIIYVTKQHGDRPTPPPLMNVIWSIARQRFEPKH
jgi:hypothetical protein